MYGLYTGVRAVYCMVYGLYTGVHTTSLYTETIYTARYRAVCGTAVVLVTQDKMAEGGLSEGHGGKTGTHDTCDGEVRKREDPTLYNQNKTTTITLTSLQTGHVRFCSFRFDHLPNGVVHEHGHRSDRPRGADLKAGEHTYITSDL